MKKVIVGLGLTTVGADPKVLPLRLYLLCHMVSKVVYLYLTILFLFKSSKLGPNNWRKILRGIILQALFFGENSQ